MKSKPMKESPANLSEIYSFHAVDDRLGTAGQPAQAQFQMIRESGFEAVINLALPTSDNAIPNEGSVVTGLGMAYVHIPVDFKAPTEENFQTFCRVMAALGDRPVFVHCAANMRVSAFVFLYRVLCQRVAIPEAERDLRAIWQPDDVWSRFIQDQLKLSGDMATTQPMLTISPEDPIGETARKLIDDLCAEVGARYGRPPSPFSLSEAAIERTIFLIARLDKEPVGCGAIRRIDEDTAEIKRMYVAPAARRRSVARRILAELERSAIDFGYRAIRLETGILQPEAQRLYESCGYKRIAAFGHYAGNPTSVCYEKVL